MQSILGSAPIFLENKYLRWYLELCRTRQAMQRDCYLEKYHILPTKLGGTNATENLVRLTGEEHFVAHWLLTKVLEGEAKRKMCYALSFFTTGNKKLNRKLTPKQFEVARKALSEAKKGFKPSAAHRAAVSKARKGVARTAEEKRKMGEKLRVKHEFYFLIDGVYGKHHDFYRFFDEHNISKGNGTSAKMKTGIAVVTAGKHKGKCFSFKDVGAEAMQQAREEVLKSTREARSAMITAQQAAIKDTRQKARNTSVTLRSPLGDIFHFETYIEAERVTRIPWTTLQSCKQELPWTFKNGRAAGWTLISRTVIKRPRAALIA